MRRFAGQTVFVTGGNKGIGRGITRRFAEEGAKVAIAAIEKDTPAAADALAADTGAEVLGLVLDVTDAAAVKEAYGEAEARLGARCRSNRSITSGATSAGVTVRSSSRLMLVTPASARPHATIAS